MEETDKDTQHFGMSGSAQRMDAREEVIESIPSSRRGEIRDLERHDVHTCMVSFMAH